MRSQSLTDPETNICKYTQIYAKETVPGSLSVPPEPQKSMQSSRGGKFLFSNSISSCKFQHPGVLSTSGKNLFGSSQRILREFLWGKGAKITWKRSRKCRWDDGKGTSRRIIQTQNKDCCLEGKQEGNEGKKGVGCRRHWDGSTGYSKRVKTSSLQEP